MIDRQAVMQAILGGGTSVAGLILVFQGYLLSAYLRFQPTDHADVKRPYKVAISAALIPLALTVLVVLGALGSLLGIDLFWPTVAGFMLSVVLLFAASCLVTVIMLR